MRVLALVVRCRWRAKNAKKIRNFCIDYSTVRFKIEIMKCSKLCHYTIVVIIVIVIFLT